MMNDDVDSATFKSVHRTVEMLRSKSFVAVHACLAHGKIARPDNYRRGGEDCVISYPFQQFQLALDFDEKVDS